ncbi:UNVERIFIED_CONTAM: Retrovirus-related Pol polyprotein from transposon [Sesamum indicum]
MERKRERIEPIEEHREIELVQGDPTRTTKIGSTMDKGLEAMMIAFLRSNADMFVWKPSDFGGISPEVIVHKLNVDPTVRPVQQKKRTFGLEKNRVISEEVDKLLKAGYISEIQYTDWLSNVVVVPKSSRKWRMCIDFTDLNKACPKDPYPLPRIDLLVDSIVGYELYSMMDAYQGYHQILMAKEDRNKTLFVTEQGIFCYNVMPFGLKNAGATYQRLVNKMFKDQIRRTMEVYVDDMLVKSRRPETHLSHLRESFDIMRAYGMKLNPTKCIFGVGGGKFLGYMVSSRGIEANPEKIEAILQLKSPTSVKDVQKLTGKIASLNRFISKSADRNLHFFKVLRKAKEFKWTEESERAFQELKDYLRSPPLLANPRQGDVLYLYLAVSKNAVSYILVREEKRAQNPIYYVCKMLQDASRDFVMELAGDQGSNSELALKIETWMLHIDDSSNASNGGVGVLLQGPKGIEIEVAAKLSFSTTNNEAEYEALILGLELARDAGVENWNRFTVSGVTDRRNL